MSLHVLEEVSVTSFLAQYHHSGVCNCYPALVSYYAHIPEAKTLCTVKFVVAVLRLFRHCLGTLFDFEEMKVCYSPQTRNGLCPSKGFVMPNAT